MRIKPTCGHSEYYDRCSKEVRGGASWSLLRIYSVGLRNVRCKGEFDTNYALFIGGTLRYEF